MQAVAAKKGDSVNVLAVNVQEDRNTAAAFSSQYGWTFPTVLDPEGKVANAFGVQGIPANFVLDKDGKIVQTMVGGVDEARLTAALDEAAR